MWSWARACVCVSVWICMFSCVFVCVSSVFMPEYVPSADWVSVWLSMCWEGTWEILLKHKFNIEWHLNNNNRPSIIFTTLLCRAYRFLFSDESCNRQTLLMNICCFPHQSHWFYRNWNVRVEWAIENVISTYIYLKEREIGERENNPHVLIWLRKWTNKSAKQNDTLKS